MCSGLSIGVNSTQRDDLKNLAFLYIFQFPALDWKDFRAKYWQIFLSLFQIFDRCLDFLKTSLERVYVCKFSSTSNEE